MLHLCFGNMGRCAGLASHLRHRVGRPRHSHEEHEALSVRMGKAHAIVRDVMGTSGGDNSRLSKMIHARFDRSCPCLLYTSDAADE